MLYRPQGLSWGTAYHIIGLLGPVSPVEFFPRSHLNATPGKPKNVRQFSPGDTLTPFPQTLSPASPALGTPGDTFPETELLAVDPGKLGEGPERIPIHSQTRDDPPSGTGLQCCLG